MTSLIVPNNGSTENASPVLILGYETSIESQNIVHQIIGGGTAHTLIRPNARNGSLELFFTDEASAFDAFNLHKLEATFTVTDTDRPSVNMTYVVDGSVDLRLTDDRKRWVVTVGYQEVDS